MKAMTAHDRVELEQRPSNLLHWLVACPLTRRLAEADIGPRAGQFSMCLEIKSCSLWSENKSCDQLCIRQI